MGDPVMVLPNIDSILLPASPSDSCDRGHEITDERKRQLHDLADALEDLTQDWDARHSYFRAAADLRNLADGRAAEVVIVEAVLRELGPHPGLLQQDTRANPFYGHLPGVTWRMLVQYHQGPIWQPIAP